MKNYSQLWAAVMRLIAGMQDAPRLTVGEYFQGCGVTKRQGRAVRKWADVALHDFLIGAVRSKVPPAEVDLLAAIPRDPMNHLRILLAIYATADS